MPHVEAYESDPASFDWFLSFSKVEMMDLIFIFALRMGIEYAS
jgi:hypothetical protein